MSSAIYTSSALQPVMPVRTLTEKTGPRFYIGRRRRSRPIRLATVAFMAITGLWSALAGVGVASLMGWTA